MNLTRRSFLAAVPSTLLARRELTCDVAVIGGGVGGCAAALAAARNGLRVVLTEETDWVGGQLTAQAVPPDEHPWIEQFGCTRSYRAYRDGVREYYRRNFPLTPDVRADPWFNPGAGTVSRLTHEPRVSLAVLEEMLAPHIGSGRLTVLLRHQAVSAAVNGDWVRSVALRSLDTGAERTLTAPYFLDATELGDLLPLTRTEFVTGAEARRQTGEPHAPEEPQPANMQAFTVCFAVDYRPGEDHTIERPDEYGFWRDYVPKMTPPWPGKLLSWSMSNPITLEPRRVTFNPGSGAEPEAGVMNLWTYRRIAARSQFAGQSYGSDISLINWPQNDYWLGNLIGVTPEEAARHVKRAKQLSFSLLYWMQTEAPRPDGGTGWKGLRLRADQTDTADGLAKSPYIREARRIQAEFTVVEQMVGTEARGKDAAESFADTVGVGSYRIDLHPTTGGNNYIDVSSLPFQIPLGALLPKRVENLIPACKNIGTTHITNGCYRLHPVEWNIGESAGMLAAQAISTSQPPRRIRSRPELLAAFQSRLQAQGIETAWPKLTPR